MGFATKILTTVASLLISYYITTLFVTSIITGTSTGDILIQTIAPIGAAAGVTIGLLIAFFRTQD
jgi:hypothetical protein